MDYLIHLISTVGYFGYGILFVILFLESFPLTFFLPGDSLLVTVGLLASQGQLDIWKLNLFLVPAAIMGDSMGYAIGHFMGPKIFRRDESFFFKKTHLERTHQFFEKYGGKTIILARFVPIVRTFAPTVAGVGSMSYRRFLSFNVFGGILWVPGMTLIGYFLGRTVPDISKHLHVVIVIVIAVSFLPILFEWFKSRKSA